MGIPENETRRATKIGCAERLFNELDKEPYQSNIVVWGMELARLVLEDYGIHIDEGPHRCRKSI